jgi:hypothetical protein
VAITQIIDEVDTSFTNGSTRSYQLASLSAIVGGESEAMRLCNMISTALHASFSLVFFDEMVVWFSR